MSKYKNEILKNMKWILLGILIVVYLVGVIYYSKFIMPKTYLNGEKISGYKISQINNNGKDDELEIQTKENKKTIVTEADIGFKLEDNGFKIHQNKFLWPISIFRTKDYKNEVNIQVDEDKYNEFVKKNLISENVIESENAKIEYIDGEYIIKDEVVGNQLDLDKLKNSLILAFKNNEKELKLEDEYIKPLITKEDKTLNQTLEDLKEINEIEIAIDFEDRKEILSGEDIIKFYDINDNGEYELSEDKSREYIKQLAIKYDTFGRERIFNATDIGDIQVDGGIYGWQMNVNETRDLLIEKIKNKESGNIQPIYIHEALYREEDDLGNTYIEIDITRQKMWYYRDGEIKVETPIVTGDITKGHPTPTGVDKLWSKERNKTLRGLNFGGSSSYAVKVDYWMPINWNDIGLHDTSYRNEYGGSIYKGNGSHGCINTPPEKIAEIFNDAPLNIPVIVYKS